jgi:V-type H+-transporting ATPase subunit H
LVEFLDSQVPKNVAIACFDLGEFCRFHTWGRKIIENFDIGNNTKINVKNKIMEKAKI